MGRYQEVIDPINQSLKLAHYEWGFKGKSLVYRTLGIIKEAGTGKGGQKTVIVKIVLLLDFGCST